MSDPMIEEKTINIHLKLNEYQIEILLESLDYHGSEVIPDIREQIINRCEQETIGGFSRQDIRENSKQNNLELTELQVNDVFTQLNRYFDASIGISWDTIEYQIDKVLGKE